ncbi:MAG: hypothetical protein IRZ08_18570 [Frankia sp.]|nr:hypothetical protein [Frankia sp.]
MGAAGAEPPSPEPAPPEPPRELAPDEPPSADVAAVAPVVETRPVAPAPPPGLLPPPVPPPVPPPGEVEVIGGWTPDVDAVRAAPAPGTAPQAWFSYEPPGAGAAAQPLVWPPVPEPEPAQPPQLASAPAPPPALAPPAPAPRAQLAPAQPAAVPSPPAARQYPPLPLVPPPGEQDWPAETGVEPTPWRAAWWQSMQLAERGFVAPVPARRLGGRRVLVGGFGGGSGRTTVTAVLGLALATLRGGRVVAIDACPDQGGPLADRAGVPGRGVGIRELVAADPPVDSLAGLRRFLGRVDRLEVLPGLRELTGPGLTPAEAGQTVDLIERFFPVVLIDAPTGWTQPVPATLLARADTVLIVARAGSAGGGAAADALATLASIRPDLSAGAVVVLVETTPARRTLAGWVRPVPPPRLAEPVHAVTTIPYDPALADPSKPVRWAALRTRTRDAFDQLAAIVDRAPVGLAPPAGQPGG